MLNAPSQSLPQVLCAVATGEVLTLPREHVSNGHSDFLRALTELRGRCQREGIAVSCLMFDLDHFQECNERISPTFGDQVLNWFACVLRSHIGANSLVAPHQSDRFVVVLPNVGLRQATEIAESCRQQTRLRSLELQPLSYEITVSAGIVESSSGFVETEQELLKRVRSALTFAKLSGRNRCVTWNDIASARPPVARAATAHNLDEIRHWASRTQERIRVTCSEAVRALVAAAEAKDPWTQEHSLTVMNNAEGIGRQMRLGSGQMATIRAAALLHDVGKIGVPDAILNKPGPLTPAEFEIIKRHPSTGIEIVEHASFLSKERRLILHHHERFDGTGYPSGLKGDAIPFGARLLAVADAVAAMSSPRSYKPAYSLEKVRTELTTGSGKQFDPAIAQAALNWLGETPKEEAASIP
ncbi:MAG: HD domain-containing phosphohydrolase [Planctomycetota bacterium]